MKKHINPFKCLALLVFALAPFLSMANTGDNIEKKRTISKSYTVGPDDRLSIENSFGNIIVTTWDKNEIQVDIEIGVHATSDERAQRMMDQINVTDHQSGKEIGFKTEIGNMGNKGKDKDNGGDDNRKFYVDYKISMPSRNPLRIENSFGKINIPDFNGTASLTSKFGELTTGKIPNAKTIHVEFGKAEIGRLNNADVVFKFNSKSTIAGIGGNSKVDVQFCSQVRLFIDKTISELSLFQSYSTIDLKVPDDLSAQFDVYTNFGSFKNRTGFNISKENEDESSGPKFDNNYTGKAGSGSSKIKI
ncbi:MAG TPA: hypothetical protein VHT72_06635, partial [Puia sp.]|nr:hypothetical protein [Puia sp.]